MMSILAEQFHSFGFGDTGLFAETCIHASAVGFLIAAIVGLAALFLPRKVPMRAANITGLVATLALGVYFVSRFVTHGREPFFNLFEVLLFTALCANIVYFALLAVRPVGVMGAFLFPATVCVYLVTLMFAGVSKSQSTDGTIVVHVLLVLLSCGLFALAAVGSGMFLIAESSVKRHKEPTWIRSFPPLDSIRALVRSCLHVALPVLTVSLVVGFWGFRDTGLGDVLLNPKVIPTLLLWVLTVLVVVGRRFGYIRGRRHYWLVIVSFVLVVVSFVGVGVVMRQDASPTGSEDACSGM